MKNHYSIKPIAAYVQKSFLTHENKDELKFLKCTIIAICLYEKEAVCLDVLLEDGSVFNYLPLTAVKTKIEGFKDNYQLKDLIYHNSSSIEITINPIKWLLNKKGIVYFKNLNSWANIEKYHFSIDWYKGNDLLNLIELENGSLAFMPNHKIKLGNKEKIFEKYKKMKSEYVV